MTTMTTIFSIGHGNRTLDDFVNLLKQYEIKYLIDIRSKPYSRFSPHFSKPALEQTLPQYDIRYVYMGDLLGGFPDNPECYTPDGRVDYAKLKLEPSYQTGIARLKRASEQNLQVAVMCSELKPQHCHRSKLIGESLAETNIPMLHIDEAGGTKNHTQVINEVKAELLRVPPAQMSLFGDDQEFSLTSRKRHDSGRATSDSPDEN